MEAFLDHAALFIEEKHARIGQAAVTVLLADAICRMLLVNALVQESELVDDLTALIGQQGIGDAVLVGKPTQDLDGVITDGKDGDVMALEIRQATLQLDELRPAKRSPFGAAMKDHERATARPDLVQTHRLAMLIREDHVGEMRPHSGADAGEIDAKIRDRRHRCSSSSRS
jgi:hypothetical protein